ncbi:MAG TPA: hypothetical protein VKR52_01245 [Terracidiphilus sp.]|nr:hypothetical protein [Terracidiphilus sp.]
MKIAKTSLALLVIQLGLVSSIAAKYFYQRMTCPRVWTRTLAYDPEAVMRGRYLSTQLIVDGCGSTLPSGKAARFPRDANGVPGGSKYAVISPQAIHFQATLAVKDKKLIAIRLPDSEDSSKGQSVGAVPDSSCENLRLDEPVDFYLPEHAIDPSARKPGQELWMEVTVPPKGPPRPLQAALKDADGTWRPVTVQ